MQDFVWLEFAHAAHFKHNLRNVDLCFPQANAEPDMKQTGERLKSLIDNLVEGTLQLVADPFAEKQVFFAHLELLR